MPRWPPVLALLATGALAAAAPTTAAPQADAAPSAAVTYAFEAQLLDLGRHDTTLADYGFNPMGGGPLLAHSVRGVFQLPGGLWLGLNLRTAVTQRTGASSVPTVIQASWTGVELGGTLVGPLRAGGDVGFSSLSAAVGSEQQGGALVYLGPFLQPRLTWRIVDGPGVVALSAGWMLQLPLGLPHDQPLWEDSFDRALFQGPTLALHSGMGTRGWK